MRRMLFIVALCGPAVAEARPTAQPLDLPDDQVALEVAAAPSLGIEASYGRRLRLPGRGLLVPGASFGLPVAAARDGRTYDAALGVSWVAPLWRGLGITGVVSFTLASARNPNADLVGLGLDLSLAPGWYAARWFVAAELGWAPNYALHVKHRAALAATFSDRYPDGHAGDGPRDGWYRGTANRLRAGLQAGVAIRRRVSLYAGAGFSHSPGELGVVVFPDVGLLPFFGRVGAAVGF